MTVTAATEAAATEVTASTAARTVQLAIRAQLLRDVAKLWPMLDKKRIGDTWPAWIHAMSLLVTSYHRQSSVAAGRMYRSDRERFTQSPAPSRLIRLAPEPPQQWLERAFGFSGPSMLQRDTARPGTALSTTLGTAARIALDGGRTTTLDTVAADPVAVGWFRVTDGDPCAFCALLASRGLVYKTDSFAQSDARFHGAGEFKVHNDCGCDLKPAWRHDTPVPALGTEADRIYRLVAKGAPSGSQLVAFRAAWAVRAQGDEAMKQAVADAFAKSSPSR